MDDTLLTIPYTVLIDILGRKEVELLLLRTRLHLVEQEVTLLKSQPSANGQPSRMKGAMTSGMHEGVSYDPTATASTVTPAD